MSQACQTSLRAHVYLHAQSMSTVTCNTVWDKARTARLFNVCKPLVVVHGTHAESCTLFLVRLWLISTLHMPWPNVYKFHTFAPSWNVHFTHLCIHKIDHTGADGYYVLGVKILMPCMHVVQCRVTCIVVWAD